MRRLKKVSRSSNRNVHQITFRLYLKLRLCWTTNREQRRSVFFFTCVYFQFQFFRAVWIGRRITIHQQTAGVAKTSIIVERFPTSMYSEGHLSTRTEAPTSSTKRIVGYQNFVPLEGHQIFAAWTDRLDAPRLQGEFHCDDLHEVWQCVWNSRLHRRGSHLNHASFIFPLSWRWTVAWITPCAQWVTPDAFFSNNFRSSTGAPIVTVPYVTFKIWNVVWMPFPIWNSITLSKNAIPHLWTPSKI